MAVGVKLGVSVLVGLRSFVLVREDIGIAGGWVAIVMVGKHQVRKIKNKNRINQQEFLKKPNMENSNLWVAVSSILIL